jgi:hypothetical protein
MAASVVIRPVGSDERAAWEPLWNGYLAFYEATLVPGASDVAWERFHDPDEGPRRRQADGHRPVPLPPLELDARQLLLSAGPVRRGSRAWSRHRTGADRGCLRALIIVIPGREARTSRRRYLFQRVGPRYRPDGWRRCRDGLSSEMPRRCLWRATCSVRMQSRVSFAAPRQASRPSSNIAIKQRWRSSSKTSRSYSSAQAC